MLTSSKMPLRFMGIAPANFNMMGSMQTASFASNNKGEKNTNMSDAKKKDIALRIKAAHELIQRVQRTEIKYMCNDSVPLDLEGTMPLPKIPQRPIVS